MASVAECVAAVNRGADWLADRQEPDGSIGREAFDNSYYKAAWAFPVAGRYVEANRLLTWIRRTQMTPDGNLRDSARQDLGSLCDRWHEVFYLYLNYWVALGAFRAGRFDVAYPAADCILSFQSDRNGGFFSDRASAERKSGFQDSLGSAFGGMVALYRGRLDCARRTGAFFEHFLRAQPEPDARLYAFFKDGGPYRDFAPDDAQWYVVDFQRTGQWYFYFGMAVGFLAWLGQVTGEAEWTALAEAYADIAERCAGDVYAVGASGKLLCGMSYLYQVTGKPVYADRVRTLCDWLVSQQHEDGSWGGTPDAPSPMASPTAEFVTWLAEATGNVGG